jgi:hypothetical protein
MIRRPKFLRGTGIAVLAVAVAAAGVVVPAAGSSSPSTGALSSTAAAQTGPRSGPAIFFEGTWYLRDSPTSGPATSVFRYGIATDRPVMGDWDGDGDDTVGVVRGTMTPGGDFVYTWYLRNSNSGGAATVTPFVFGTIVPIFVDQIGTIPIVGDWDGDGDDTVGVMTYSQDLDLNGPMIWRVRNSNTAGPADVTVSYSRGRDLPVVGDWDGDGDDSIGVYRRGHWLLRNAVAGGIADLNFAYGSRGGVGLELPVPGDWDGNGTDTPAVLRNSPPTDIDGGLEHWLLRNSNSSGTATSQIAYGSDAFPIGLPFDAIPRLSWTPAPPGAVTVTAARPSGGSGEVDFLWDTVPDATGYRIMRSSTPGGAATQVANIDVATGTATVAPGVIYIRSDQHTYIPPSGRLARPDTSPSFQYIDYGEAGQRCYRVIAYNAAGAAPPSPEACSPPAGD